MDKTRIRRWLRRGVMDRARVRRWFRRGVIALATGVVSMVFVSHQFPGIVTGPMSSTEILSSMFRAPVSVPLDMAKIVAGYAGREGVSVFLQTLDLPDDAERRIVKMLDGAQLEEVTVPFVLYLYELYGTTADAENEDLSDLAYDEPAVSEAGGGASPGVSMLVTTRGRAQLRLALRLFDALFLRVPLEVNKDPSKLARLVDEKVVEDIASIIEEIAEPMFEQSDDTASAEGGHGAEMKKILEDPETLQVFVQCLTDMVRGLTESWARSYLAQQERRQERSAWVDQAIANNEYYRISDWAGSALERRIVLHVVVDGLQGKLLEGLVDLSSNKQDSAPARYVRDLVSMHRRPPLSDPPQAGFPGPLGTWISGLSDGPRQETEYLENLRKHIFAADAASVVVNVATVDTPSISVRNLPIVFHGHSVAGPHGTGIPNFSFLDRPTGRGWYFWGSDVLQMKKIFSNYEDTESGVVARPGSGAKTIFQRLWRHNTLSCMATIDTGALTKLSSEIGVAVGEAQRNFMEKTFIIEMRRRAEMERQLNEKRRWLVAHRKLSRSFLGSLLWDSLDLESFHAAARFLAEHEDEGIPDYVLWYNPWPDHYAHGTGPYHDECVGKRGEYDRFDFYLGKLLDVYSSVEGPNSESYLDRTLCGLVSDHGLIYTPKTLPFESLLFGAMKDDGWSVRVLKLTADEGELPVIHARGDSVPTKPFDVVVGCTAGGSYVLDIFSEKGIRGDEAAWTKHPDYHELRSMNLSRHGSPENVDWIHEIQSRLGEALDIAVVREYGPKRGVAWANDIESAVRIFSGDGGEARIVRIEIGGGEATRYRYEILGGRDPLKIETSFREYLVPDQIPADRARAALSRCLDAKEGCSEIEWSEVLSTTLRADSVYQLSHLYDSSRAGTINLFPARHVGVNSSVPGRHAGECFGEKNGTQVYFGARIRRGRMQTARNGSVPVTLYHWLVGDEIYRKPGIDGSSPAEQFGFPSLIEHLSFLDP